MSSITEVTPTICKIMGIEPPSLSSKSTISKIIESAEWILGAENVKKILLYAPDAIGEGLYYGFKDFFAPVKAIAPIEINMISVLPTYTPVCFGSMFTGAQPEQHGIRKYEKPILKCDTLFDALVRAGKKVAIVAVKDSSIDKVFRGRDIDYYSEEYDDQVTERVLQLIVHKNYDLILVYHQEYDDLMHGSTPRDPKALDAFKRHLASFIKLSDSFNIKNRSSNRAIAFVPDHGTHIDPITGKGAHGTDSSDDVNIRHLWGIYRGS